METDQTTNDSRVGASAHAATICLILGLVWVAFQVYIMKVPQGPLVSRPIHLGLAMAIAILARPSWPNRSGAAYRVIDRILLGAVAASLVYYLRNVERLTAHMEAVDPVLPQDILFGTIMVVVLLECVRRVIGWTLLGVILAFLLYAYIGRLWPGWVALPWVPELFKFSGSSIAESVENFTMRPSGILGLTTATSVQFVFYFVLFGAIYSAIGGGQYFIDIGLKIAAKRRAGASKAAVIASGLMGSISGSAVANVATTGLFTIPLMRRTGYTATFAAGVEAIASTGGQLMPPVMGVAAFVMADQLQIEYVQIALAGIIPAVAFYFSLLLLLDFHCRRSGIGTTADEDLAPTHIATRLYLLLPPVVLVWLLVAGRSAGSSALVATALCIPTCYLGYLLLKFLAGRNATKYSELFAKAWVGPRDWIRALDRGARQAAEVAVPIAAIGIIIEVCAQSGLTLEFSADLADMSGGSLVATLALIIVACIIMGMGLPTVAAYIIGSTLFVPTLIENGVEDIPANFFVMYYCVLSMVTPPVALASYTAAGLAGADSTVTSLQAFRFSLVAFFIPFAFVFQPSLLGQYTIWWEIPLASLVLALGIFGWAAALEGYFLRTLYFVERIVIGIVALGVIFSPIFATRLAANTDETAGTHLLVTFVAILAVPVALGISRLIGPRAQLA